MKLFKQWLETNRATRGRIALKAGTSVATMMQVARGDRNASAEWAAQVEKAGGPPRQHTCEACAKCPHVRGAK